MAKGKKKLDITPDVGVFSLFPHVEYEPWYAVAEFVDNALQSYLKNQQAIENVDGKGWLKVVITHDTSGNSLEITDSACGISLKDFPRAFRPARPPADRTGLSEFGIGMKTAASWFANDWSVRTKALGESVEREIAFNIERIVRDLSRKLDYDERPMHKEAHYTVIRLSGLRDPLQPRTIGKVKEHLASIYRAFLRQGVMQIFWGEELLEYEEPKVLTAPYYKDRKGAQAKFWRKPIELKLAGGKIRITGFAGIREKASTSNAGLALLRRNRLIVGAGEHAWRPEEIFGKPNSFRSQRLFGELTIDGLAVSHTKSGFKWSGYKEEFLDKLAEALDEKPLPLLEQAEEYRAKLNKKELEKPAKQALESTARMMEGSAELRDTLAHQVASRVEAGEPVEELPQALTAAERDVIVDFKGTSWQIHIDLSADHSMTDWLSVSEKAVREPGKKDVRRLGIRLSLVHPFMQEFAINTEAKIEPLLRVAVALALAEETARESGADLPGAIRRNLNELLRKAMWRR